mmetsp:Transcript_38411/g.90660  ORF Transcript_38411/g.90660 Transcript_38411/m.90660 type:complete len:213 (+) Transcript_38411:380-1018(+)
MRAGPLPPVPSLPALSPPLLVSHVRVALRRDSRVLVGNGIVRRGLRLPRGREVIFGRAPLVADSHETVSRVGHRDVNDEAQRDEGRQYGQAPCPLRPTERTPEHRAPHHSVQTRDSCLVSQHKVGQRTEYKSEQKREPRNPTLCHRWESTPDLRAQCSARPRELVGCAEGQGPDLKEEPRGEGAQREGSDDQDRHQHCRGSRLCTCRHRRQL